jgi:hypothetical protein
MPVRIIINADDLGASVEVNDAIFDMMKHGLVTSATILANAPGTADALERLDRFSICSFGAHLNVMDYPPLTKASAFDDLLDSDGVFAATLDRAALTGELRRAIGDEWCAQVQLLLDQGVKLSHLDSHYHVHSRPGLFRVFKAVQRRFDIRRARLTKNLYSRTQPPASRALPLKKKLWNFALRHHVITNTADYFTEFSTFMEIVEEVSWHNQTIELMVHPGSPDCKDETALLEKFRVSELPFEARLISYDEL